MNHLTSYQHAHDAAGERAADRDEEITREGEFIARTRTELAVVIEEWLHEKEPDLSGLLELLYQSRLTKPPVGTADKLEQALRNLCSNINDAITREATARVDARETEE